jgi:hypothetical protein
MSFPLSITATTSKYQTQHILSFYIPFLADGMRPMALQHYTRKC